MSQATIATWEREKAKPSPLAWKALVEFLCSLQKQKTGLKTLKYFKKSKINIKKCPLFQTYTTIKVEEKGKDMSLNIDSLPTRDEIELSGNDIKRIRERLGLNQAEFSRKLGITRVTLWGWETDRAKPSPLAREKLIEVLSSYQRLKEQLKGIKYF